MFTGGLLFHYRKTRPLVIHFKEISCDELYQWTFLYELSARKAYTESIGLSVDINVEFGSTVVSGVSAHFNHHINQNANWIAKKHNNKFNWWQESGILTRRENEPSIFAETELQQQLDLFLLSLPLSSTASFSLSLLNEIRKFTQLSKWCVCIAAAVFFSSFRFHCFYSLRVRL